MKKSRTNFKTRKRRKMKARRLWKRTRAPKRKARKATQKWPNNKI